MMFHAYVGGQLQLVRNPKITNSSYPSVVEVILVLAQQPT